MSDIYLSRKGERKVTSFVGQELLYDYLKGDLDPERTLAVEALLNDNRDLKAELERIREGMNYVLSLQKTQVSSALSQQIRMPSTYFHVLIQKMKISEWSEGVRLAVEGVIVAIGALTIILLVPWSKVLRWQSFENSPVVLSEVTKTQSVDPDAELNPEGAAAANSNAGVVFDDEAAKPVPAPSVVAKQVDQKPIQEKAPEPQKKPEVVAAAPAESAPAASESSKRQGILFRGSIAVTNLDAVTPKLVEYIQSIGGRKAGEVELGWKKGNGSYFHFTIPEAKYKALQDLLGEYGTPRIQKEPHPRVMPDGIIRLIITVDEKK